MIKNHSPQSHGKIVHLAAKDTNGLSTKQLQQFYHDMLLIRRFEERAGQLYGMGLIGGFCHLYIGQEAVVTGMQSVIKKTDSVITTYRDHGHMLAAGMNPKGVMAELTGRKDGYSKGKGGSMHMFSRENNFFGGHGVVGTSAPLGAGLAFANKYNNTDDVVLSYFGDGAANQGQVYEALNMASLWSLPIIFLIENNQYAMGTAVERASAETQLYKRGSAFNIPGEQVNGMDVTEVFKAGKKAVDYCRSEKRPIILEMMTYRYRGHSMSDPAQYRTREEVDRVRSEQDPIDSLKEKLLTRGVDDSALKSIDKEIRESINKAVEFAKQCPEPDPSELTTDIFVDM